MKSELVRMTLNLTPQAAAALENITRIEGGTKTDAVVSALKRYGELLGLQESGKVLYVRGEDGELERVRFL